MAEFRASQSLPQAQSGCRTILIRLLFRNEKGTDYRSWLAHRPLRLVVTFTRTKTQSEEEFVRGDKRE